MAANPTTDTATVVTRRHLWVTVRGRQTMRPGLATFLDDAVNPSSEGAVVRVRLGAGNAFEEREDQKHDCEERRQQRDWDCPRREGPQPEQGPHLREQPAQPHTDPRRDPVGEGSRSVRGCGQVTDE